MKKEVPESYEKILMESSVKPSIYNSGDSHNIMEIINKNDMTIITDNNEFFDLLNQIDERQRIRLTTMEKN